MHRITTLYFFVIVAVGVVVAAEKPIQPPKFISVNVPGEDFTTVAAINNAKVIVGTYSGPGDAGFAVVGGQRFRISFGVPDSTVCLGVNSTNAIVGEYQPSGGSILRGFLYQNGQFTDIGPGDGTAVATAVNDLGQIVGWYNNAGTVSSFFWDGKTYQQIDPPGATLAQAWGINNAGQITLQWSDALGEYSSIFDGTSYTKIEVPGSSFTAAFNINNFGDVAITWLDSTGADHAAVFKGGKYYSFAYPGYNQTAASGINDQDLVTGEAWKSAGDLSTGYVMIP